MHSSSVSISMKPFEETQVDDDTFRNMEPEDMLERLTPSFV